MKNSHYLKFTKINDKVLNWKKFEKGMTQVKTSNKVVVAVQEVISLLMKCVIYPFNSR